MQAQAASVSNIAPSYTTTQLPPTREEGLDIKGELPAVQNLNDFGLLLNQDIQDTYRQKVAAAKESKARSITFGCEYYSSRSGVSSIVLTTRIVTAVTKDEVDSFNYIPAESRLVGVNDILGPNGLQIANKVISQRIRSDPETYYTNFPGLQDTDAFHVTNDGNIVFLFDAFQIAPGSVGVTSFTLKISDIVNTMPFQKDDGYWIKDTSYSLKMVSLRAVCDNLGYSIGWNNSTKEITVSRNDGSDVSVSFMIDVNNYKSSSPDAPDKVQKRSLESAPVMIGGVTYVPISFFDQILELVAYHVDDNDNIIFSSYLGS